MKKAWEKWKEIAEKIGNFQANLIFSLFYFVLVTPIGIIASLFKDLLFTKSSPEWMKFDNNTSTINQLKEQ